MKGNSRDNLLTREEAAAEISGALNIRFEAAMMTLYGLCTTGNLRFVDDDGEIIDFEECTIDEFERNAPAFVSAEDVRHWLNEWAPAPQRSQRDTVIAELIKGPPLSQKQFCDSVRARCNGWQSKGKPARGFGNKQILRIRDELRRD
jgi:hypothetical protein